MRNANTVGKPGITYILDGEHGQEKRVITRIKNHNINDIRSGINYLLEKASQDEEVRQFAIQITTGEPDKIAAIYDWVKTNVQYIPDPIGIEDEIELFISPSRMIRNYNQERPIAGDCDDHSLLSTALYRSIGIPSNVVILDTKGEGYDHAISEVYSEKLKKYVTVDTTVDYPLGWEFPYKSKIVVK